MLAMRAEEYQRLTTANRQQMVACANTRRRLVCQPITVDRKKRPGRGPLAGRRVFPGWISIMTYGPGTQNFGLVSVGVLVSLILLVAAAVWVAQNRDLVPMLWARLRNVAAVTRAEAWAREKLHDRGWSLPLRWPLSEVAGVALLVGLAVVVALGLALPRCSMTCSRVTVSPVSTNRPLGGWQPTATCG
ncbi:PAP2 superfamily domain protein [Mycobacterium xenopi 4042]|uniref:PAP2 superfamily domain protein n=1 Tax=Mycobacterium xenopi 4042 TaxID=1299334 RepID=X7YR16_MYCXE|nr:PAP2 superfamily domain protein [Mycobacterium xenopi 4042]